MIWRRRSCRWGAERRAADAGMLGLAGCPAGATTLAEFELSPGEVAEEPVPFAVGGVAVLLRGP